MIKIMLFTLLLADEAPKPGTDSITARTIYDSYLDILRHPVCCNHKHIATADLYLRSRYRGAFSFFREVTGYSFDTNTFYDCQFSRFRRRHLRQAVADLKKWEDKNMDHLTVDDTWARLDKFFFRRDGNKISYCEPSCFMY